MIKIKNYIGLFALFLSLQASGNEINIQDAWIRSITPGQEDAMVGMVINSARQARIVSVISPAYKFVAMQGPGRGGENKTQEIEFIDLPAQKSVVLDAESVHLLLLGNKQTQRANDKVSLIVTIQFEDNTSKTITIKAQPILSKNEAAMLLNGNVAAQAGTAIAPSAPQNAADLSDETKAKSVKTPNPAPGKAMPSPAEAAGHAKPAVVNKPAVAESKPLKPVPVAVPKPAPAPVAVHVVTAPLPAPVAAPAPVVAPVAAPLASEAVKAPPASPATQPKPDAALASSDCLSLAEEIANCDPSNDRLLEWCETSTKAKYSCQLTIQQLKKLKK